MLALGYYGTEVYDISMTFVTLPIANARGFSGYPELQESVPGQCPGIYA